MNRRIALRTLSTAVVVAVYAPAMLLTGCWNASDIAALMSTLGGACSQLAGILGNSALAATIATLTSAAATAIGNWKTGSPTAEAIEAINALEAAISTIGGINPTIALLVTLALGTADAILALLPAAAVTPAVSVAMSKRTRIKLNAAPTKKATFVDYWNGLIAGSADATLVGAKI